MCNGCAAQTWGDFELIDTARTLARKARTLLPVRGFAFDRPLVLLQSDDWGRVGVRDKDAWESLRAAGVNLGEKPYDYYSMETAADVSALNELLASHRDHSGRSACMQMNFMAANVDFVRTVRDDFKTIHLKSLHEGLPGTWQRPGLLEAFRSGIEDDVFHPGLHGLTHFCLSAVQSYASQSNERGQLLRTLWEAEAPYIHWRMPWVGFEYWDAELPLKQRFLSGTRQAALIREAAGMFKKMFGTVAMTAAAPGYRANDDTHRSWAAVGILVAQNGPNPARAPYVDQQGLLHLFRGLDFDPATDQNFSLERALRQAGSRIARGLPLIVSVHAINFQSSLRDFRGSTLNSLNQFLSGLEKRYPDLCYIHDADLWQIVHYGKYDHPAGMVKVTAQHKSLPGSYWMDEVSA